MHDLPSETARRRWSDGERGAALIAVLVTLAVVAMLVAGVTMLARSDGLRARRALDDLRTDAAFDAVLAATLNALVSLALESATGRPSPLPGEFPVGDGRILVSVRAEDGKLDLNSASEPTLAAVFEAWGLARDQAARLADRVADWRDGDDLTHLLGAEAPDYAAAGRSGGPANRPFGDPDDLALVLGAPQWLVDCLRPELTVQSGRMEPDMAAASPRLRAALGGVAAPGAEGVARPLQGGTAVEIVARLVDARGRLRRAVQWTVRATGAQADPVWILDRRDRGMIDARAALACRNRGRGP